MKLCASGSECLALLLCIAMSETASAFVPGSFIATRGRTGSVQSSGCIPATLSRLSSNRKHVVSVSMSEASESLASIFRDEHASQVGELGDRSIVEMLPKESSTSEGNAPLRQELFSSPLIPFMYERILPPVWAAGLRVGGMDQEYAEVASFLQGDGSGTVLDLSCGTGFIARRLAASRTFKHVVALDYSKEMLQELLSEIEQQRRGWKPPNLERGSLSVVRGDAGRLPFKDGSLDAVHWGAAMHCVPDTELAMSEVYRVLKPGGKLYATTFLRPLPDLVFRFFTLEELREIASSAGFSNGEQGREGGTMKVERLGPVYGVIKAVK